VAKRFTNDSLSDHGGWILVAVGIGLITLAAVFADRVSLAPIFAFCGIASIVFGVFLPRMEGQTEFSTTGVKFVLKATKQALGQRHLTPEQVANVYETSLVDIEELVTAKPAPEAHPDATAARRRTTETEPARAGDFEEQIVTWLTKSGWHVDRSVTRAGQVDDGFDFRATRGNEVVSVQVKSTTRIGAADIAATAFLLEHFALDLPHAVLVVRSGAVTGFALEQAYAVSDVLSVYEARGDGEFELLSGVNVVEFPNSLSRAVRRSARGDASQKEGDRG
jgi:hypothetical protein